MVSIGTVWDRTTEFVRDHQSRVAMVVLLTLFVPTVVTGSLQPLAETAGSGTKVVLALVTLVATLVSLWGQLYLTGYAAAEVEGGSAASARATRRFVPVIAITLLLMLAFALLAIPAVLIGVGSGIDFPALAAGESPTPEAMASFGWVALYGILLLPILLWVGARLLVLTPVVLMERRGVGAIGRAFGLTRGLALKLVGVILLYAVVSGVAVSAAQFVFGSILALVAGGDGPVTVAGVLTAVVVAAVSTVLSLLAAVFIGKLYLAITGERDQAAIFE